MFEEANNPEESENFYNLSTDYFSLTNSSCQIAVDTITNLDGSISHPSKYRATEGAPLYYAFSGTEGLCRTTQQGSVRVRNLLGVLLSIPSEMSALLAFFTENGFLFPLDSESFEEIDNHALLEILNHMKATVSLMSELELPQPHTEKLLFLTLYLLLSEPVSIKLSKQPAGYSSCHHPVIELIKDSSRIPERVRSEYDDTDYYEVKDMIYGRVFISDEEVYGITNGFSDADPNWIYTNELYKEVCWAYIHGTHLPKQHRLIIDFLFNFMRRVGVIDGVTYAGGIEINNEPAMDKFGEEMENALNAVARIVLREEINQNIRGIRPRFSVTNMEPSWIADSLLSALYFSIFYMKPGSEIYRQCANPSCNKRFPVKTTNSRKIYCCDACRNATAQRNHRFRLKNAQK